MIKKLDVLDSTVNVFNTEDFVYNVAIGTDTINKINEIIDAINTMQKEKEAERFEIQEWLGVLETVRKSVNDHEKQIGELQMKLEPEKYETPSDPYAEQRKWIGKLCKFWDNEKEDGFYYVLCCIDEDSEYPYIRRGYSDAGYKHCEPASEDLIYKGE